MLNVLRQIVQEVNEAQDLQEVLSIIVNQVSTTIATEACSVYLVDRRENHYVLAAAVGFRPGLEGKVALAFSEGLVGLVGEREEPINIENAKEHPRYRYFPETGEEKYKAFLGVPIIHQRKLVGIIVVQQRERRRFDEGEEAFLVTISAQLAGEIAHAQTAGMIADFSVKEDVASGSTLRGIGASPGVGIGQAIIAYVPADLEAVPKKLTDNIPKEKERYYHALEAAKADIRKLQNRLKGVLPMEEQALFDAYLAILDSSSLQKEVLKLIDNGYWAPWALRKIIKSHIHRFDTMEDPYLRERASDLLDLGQRVLKHLQKDDNHTMHYQDGTILIGTDVTASSLAEVPAGKLEALVCAKGSANSHVAILARAMGIPAVMGVSGLPVHSLEGRQVIVDGYNGEVFSSPSRAMVDEFSRLAEEEKELYKGLEQLKELKAQTPDGRKIPLHVNTGLVADIRPSLEVGAEGVGLYRTEIPFMIRDRFPGEEEQYLIYRQLLEAFAPNPVTIRTLDVGGDKQLPYFPVNEENPFLGWRGIRVTLDHPEIFLVQLRAMLKANAKLNNLKILFPMVSQIQEVDEAIRLVRQAYREVTDEGDELAFPQIGAMIEVPAAVYQAKALIERVDFFALGSNDLTQYLLAVDRNNPNVANLYDPLHPSVLRAMQVTIEAAHQAGKKISICGEMASDPAAVIALIGLGFDAFSMNATGLPKVKWVIRNFTVDKANALLCKAMNMENARDIRSHFESALEEAGLGGLVRAGK